LNSDALFGATAIVLARLGAKVVAIDVKDGNVAVSQANAAKHGESVTFQHVADSRALPFPSCAFMAITCVSVLEYVKRDHLPDVLRELDRVLAPGGVVLIQGTSNRISPMEAHSRRWFVNWLPHWIMPSLKRGIWPGQIAFEGYENLALADNDQAYLLARKAGPIVRTTARVAHAFGKPIGYFTPSIYLALKKIRT
jgi:ubiquinone/menaquinone biosynthesis C-methylase UbiE